MALPLIAAGVVGGGLVVGAALSASPDADAEVETRTENNPDTDSEVNGGKGRNSNQTVDKIDTDSGVNGRKGRNSNQTVDKIDTDSGVNGRKGRNSNQTVDEAENDGNNRLSLAGGSAVIIAGSRQAGLDRHSEAALAEELHAKEYARKVGGTVVEDTGSVFSPDGGIDKTVQVGPEEIKIQSKHYGKKISESVLQEYENVDDVDVIATSNGISPNVDAHDYEIEVFTADEWSIGSKSRLEIRRVLKGIKKELDGVRGYLGKIANACRKLSTKVTSILGRLTNATSGIARAAVKRVLGLTTLQKVGLAAVVVAVLWVVWRRVSTDSDSGLHLLRVTSA